MNTKKVMLLAALLHLAGAALRAQSQDSTQASASVSGSVAVTNNGVSLVPTFTLGKPATLVSLSVAKKRFSFDPLLSFSLEDAKPWFFVFWLRYKLVQTPRFNLGAGFHPGFVFSSKLLANGAGVPREYITASRYFVGELTPTYTLSKKASVGMYYLHSRGYNSDLKRLRFIGLNGSLSDIGLGGKYYLNVSPQVYYLWIDGQEGLYVTSTFTVGRRGFPLSVSSVLNRKLRSEIKSKQLVWNVSLVGKF
ncbi:MAG: hypothetical protein RI973_896 [Bacteroidota bacterium]|jgi:hypothetical protein